MELHKETPVYLFTNVTDWELWLAKYHTIEKAVWVKFAKKNTGAVSISYAQALDVALCYGWIDGLVNKYDKKYYLQRFTPRSPRSIWSKINKENIARLIKEKRMQAAGLAAVKIAKKNGQWDGAYDPPKDMKVPEDFVAAVKKDQKAWEFYQTLTRANTYAIAWRLATAKRPETRDRRFKLLLEMVKRGEKLH